MDSIRTIQLKESILQNNDADAENSVPSLTRQAYITST